MYNLHTHHILELLNKHNNIHLRRCWENICFDRLRLASTCLEDSLAVGCRDENFLIFLYLYCLHTNFETFTPWKPPQDGGGSSNRQDNCWITSGSWKWWKDEKHQLVGRKTGWLQIIKSKQLSRLLLLVVSWNVAAFVTCEIGVSGICFIIPADLALPWKRCIRSKRYRTNLRLFGARTARFNRLMRCFFPHRLMRCDWLTACILWSPVGVKTHGLMMFSSKTEFELRFFVDNLVRICCEMSASETWTCLSS